MTWWILGAAGLLVGGGSWRWLRSATYRYPDDVTRLSLNFSWVVVPMSAAGGAAASAVPDRLVAASWLFLVVGAVVFWIDIDVHRVPDAITRWWAPATIVTLIVASAITGMWTTLIWALVGALVLGAFFLILALVGSMGIGDVKLSAIAGLVLGPLGWSSMITAVIAAFLLATALALALLARGAGRGAHLAFGPAIIAGSAIAISLSAATV